MRPPVITHHQAFCLTSASKFHIEPNGGVFDVSAKNDGASPMCKLPEDALTTMFHVPGLRPHTHTHTHTRTPC